LLQLELLVENKKNVEAAFKIFAHDDVERLKKILFGKSQQLRGAFFRVQKKQGVLENKKSDHFARKINGALLKNFPALRLAYALENFFENKIFFFQKIIVLRQVVQVLLHDFLEKFLENALIFAC
jgi:hypothetical protein